MSAVPVCPRAVLLHNAVLRRSLVNGFLIRAGVITVTGGCATFEAGRSKIIRGYNRRKPGLRLSPRSVIFLESGKRHSFLISILYRLVHCLERTAYAIIINHFAQVRLRVGFKHGAGQDVVLRTILSMSCRCLKQQQ